MPVTANGPHQCREWPTPNVRVTPALSVSGIDLRVLWCFTLIPGLSSGAHSKCDQIRYNEYNSNTHHDRLDQHSAGRGIVQEERASTGDGNNDRGTDRWKSGLYQSSHSALIVRDVMNRPAGSQELARG